MMTTAQNSCKCPPLYTPPPDIGCDGSRWLIYITLYICLFCSETAERPVSAASASSHIVNWWGCWNWWRTWWDISRSV